MFYLGVVVQAALAVGAVKDGHDTPAQKDTSHQPKVSNPDRWDRTNHGRDTRGLEVDLRNVRLLSPEKSHLPQRRESELLSGERSRSLEEERERTPHELSAEEHAFREEKTGTGVVGQQAGAHATAATSSEKTGNLPKYGRDFYHDSRGSLELMPTLQETDGSSEQTKSPLRSGAPPSLQQEETRQEQGGNEKVKPSWSTTRPPCRVAPRKTTTTAVVAEEYDMTTVAHSIVDSKPRRRASLHAEEQERGNAEHRLVEQPPPTVKRASRATSSERKHRPIEVSRTPPPLHGNRAWVEGSSLNARHCLARDDLGETRDRAANAGAPSIAAGGRGGHLVVASDHTTFATEREELLYEPPSSQLNLAQPDEGEVRAGSKSSGRSRKIEPTWSGLGKSRHSVSLSSCVATEVTEVGRGGVGLSEHIPGGLSTRKGMGAVARNNTALRTNFQPEATSQFSSSRKEVDSGKDVGIIPSPAPCHGGSPSAIPIPTVPPEASEALDGPTPRRALVVDLRLPPPKLPPGLHLDLGTFSSPHYDAREKIVQKENEGLLYAGCSGVATSRFDSLDECEKEASGLGGDTDVAQREDDNELAGTGWISRADHFTMDVEAAGCTPALYEELLEPRVASVYSRLDGRYSLWGWM